MFSWLRRLVKHNYFKVIKYEKFDGEIYPLVTVYINGMHPIDFNRDLKGANRYIKNFIESHKRYGIQLIEILENEDGDKIFYKKFID